MLDFSRLEQYRENNRIEAKKALGGLPGMQKEGVDGIITEACFIIHKKPQHKRVMVLEFFGRSMHPAAVVVRELVALRNRIRQEGDYAHLSALEEFNAKYVQAIEYKRKSEKYEGLPISVIILQADGDDPYLLDKCVGDIVSVPISHGEGRFLASEELVKQLAENGQIATQYVDLNGNPTADIHFNPNNSVWAVEGITSPDGRVFGKMGHSERTGAGLYRNVPGEYDMKLFRSAVEYFK